MVDIRNRLAATHAGDFSLSVLLPAPEYPSLVLTTAAPSTCSGLPRTPGCPPEVMVPRQNRRQSYLFAIVVIPPI